MQLIYLTNTELDTLKDNLAQAFAYKTAKYYKFITYGSVKYNSLDRICKLTLLYILCLNEWNQHDDGTTSGLFNYITREQFSNMVNEIRKITSFNLGN